MSPTMKSSLVTNSTRIRRYFSNGLVVTATGLFLLLSGTSNAFDSSQHAVDDAVGSVPWCKKICAEYYASSINRSTCRPALDVHPRPAVYRSCVSGIVMAFDDACQSTCTVSDKIGLPSPRALETCANSTTAARNMGWCRRGYEGSFWKILEEVKASVTDRRRLESEQQERNNDVLALSEKYGGDENLKLLNDALADGTDSKCSGLNNGDVSIEICHQNKDDKYAKTQNAVLNSRGTYPTDQKLNNEVSIHEYDDSFIVQEIDEEYDGSIIDNIHKNASKSFSVTVNHQIDEGADIPQNQEEALYHLDQANIIASDEEIKNIGGISSDITPDSFLRGESLIDNTDVKDTSTDLDKQEYLQTNRDGSDVRMSQGEKPNYSKLSYNHTEIEANDSFLSETGLLPVKGSMEG